MTSTVTGGKRKRARVAKKKTAGRKPKRTTKRTTKRTVKRGGAKRKAGRKASHKVGHKKARRSTKRTGGRAGPSRTQLEREAKRLGIPLSKHGVKKTKASLARAIAHRK